VCKVLALTDVLQLFNATATIREPPATIWVLIGVVVRRKGMQSAVGKAAGDERVFILGQGRTGRWGRRNSQVPRLVALIFPLTKSGFVLDGEQCRSNPELGVSLGRASLSPP